MGGSIGMGFSWKLQKGFPPRLAQLVQCLQPATWHQPLLNRSHNQPQTHRNQHHLKSLNNLSLQTRQIASTLHRQWRLPRSNMKRHHRRTYRRATPEMHWLQAQAATHQSASLPSISASILTIQITTATQIRSSTTSAARSLRFSRSI